MGRLKSLVIADPSPEAADTIARETERLAEQRFVATTGKEALELIERHRPEAVLISLELKRPDAAEVVTAVTKREGNPFVVATFRELSVPAMEALGKLGVEDFIPQPIDFVQLFRAASQRFGAFFRRHDRLETTLEVFRVDGVLAGRTVDISEGGLQMRCETAVHAGHSLLVDIVLPEDFGKVRVRAQIIAAEGEAPMPITARAQFQNLRGEDQRRLSNFLTRRLDQ